MNGLDYCVCCGEYVPEGTMVCRVCWKRYMENAEEEEPEDERKSMAFHNIICYDRRKEK